MKCIEKKFDNKYIYHNIITTLVVNGDTQTWLWILQSCPAFQAEAFFALLVGICNVWYCGPPPHPHFAWWNCPTAETEWQRKGVRPLSPAGFNQDAISRGPLVMYCCGKYIPLTVFSLHETGLLNYIVLHWILILFLCEQLLTGIL